MTSNRTAKSRSGARPPPRGQGVRRVQLQPPAAALTMRCSPYHSAPLAVDSEIAFTTHFPRGLSGLLALPLWLVGAPARRSEALPRPRGGRT